MVIKAGLVRRTISLRREQWTAIDALAIRTGRPRFDVIRHVIELGLRELTPDDAAAIERTLDQPALFDFDIDDPGDAAELAEVRQAHERAGAR